MSRELKSLIKSNLENAGGTVENAASNLVELLGSMVETNHPLVSRTALRMDENADDSDVCERLETIVNTIAWRLEERLTAQYEAEAARIGEDITDEQEAALARKYRLA